jgi:hypothetical protein
VQLGGLLKLYRTAVLPDAGRRTDGAAHAHRNEPRVDVGAGPNDLRNFRDVELGRRKRSNTLRSGSDRHCDGRAGGGQHKCHRYFSVRRPERGQGVSLELASL